MRPLAIYYVHGEAFKPLLETALKASELQLSAPVSSRTSESFLDSFDWRLYKEGLQCRRRGDVFELSQLDKRGKPLLAKPKRPENAKFAKDFPKGAFHDTIAEICQMRALMEVCSLSRINMEWKLFDSAGKSVAKLRHERVFTFGEPPGELVSFLSIYAVKGYEADAERLCEALTKLGLPRHLVAPDELRMALGAAGRSPDDYSSSFIAPVKAAMSCRQAASAILLKLIGTMSRNVSGLLNDTDVEFLHDFRVASRRIRSAVSQIKGVFPEQDALHLKRDFAGIGKLTNNLRDLDVLLMARPEYDEAIPEELHPGLNALFGELAKRRAQEFKKLAAALSSDSHAKTLKRWADYLNSSSALPKCPNSETPVNELAGHFILKRLKRVRKFADKLDEHSPDSEMHALRIECKKLRYLLEFFGPLFDRNGVAKVVERLKRLQDFLGGLNDLSVQQRFLSASLSHLPIKGPRSLLTAAALGALIAKLCERRRKLKGSFSKVFDKFLDKAEFEDVKAIFDIKTSR